MLTIIARFASCRITTNTLRGAAPVMPIGLRVFKPVPFVAEPSQAK